MGGKPKTIANGAAALREIAGLQVHDTIGRHALALLAGGAPVTLDDLIAALEEAARVAPRAIGGFEPERMRAEAALATLRKLREQAAAPRS